MIGCSRTGGNVPPSVSQSRSRWGSFSLVFSFESSVSPSRAFRDGIYPSIFFLTTGFHGLHVIIGTVLLSIYLYRVIQARSADGVGFIATAASWYWHFVDAVWLLLFAVFYAWAG